jgi:hypothetical protein
MRRHVRAVILLGARLLIVPPLEWKDGEWVCDRSAPISSWIQVSAHQDATGCETLKRSEQDRWLGPVDPKTGTRIIDRAKAAKLSPAKVQAVTQAYTSARCVPAENMPTEPTQR